MPGRPAILLITTDQLRRDALGCYGNRAVATPNLDRLADSGTVYDRAYTASPWCLPSRSSIVTGQYPRNHRAYSNFRDCTLSADVPNLYSTLRSAGYEVGHVGKCHYAPVPYGQTRADRTLPYEEFRDYYLSLGIDHLDLQDDKQVSVWFYDDYAKELEAAGHLEAYRAAIWNRDDRKVFAFPGPAEWHPDSWVGRKTSAWLRSVDGDNPVFCWASFSGPHFPFDPPAEYLARVDEDALGEAVVRAGEFENPERIHHGSYHSHYGRGGMEEGEDSDGYWRRLRRNYMANVALIDDRVGEVIAAAEERFGDDLVVVFSCDHGEMLGNHGFWGKHDSFYQDVVNVPLLYRRPGRAGAGARSDRLTSLVDIFPTLCETARADPGEVDGRTLDGEGHPHVFSEGERFLSVTDGRHKLVTVRKGGANRTEMFDLESDPYEFTSVAGRPEHAEVQRDLQAAALGALLDTTLP